MALYALTASPDVILRTSDGASIPTDPANADYQAFLAWDALPGNTPDPAPPPSPAGAIADSAQSLALAQANSLAAQGKTDEALAAVLKFLGGTTP